MPKTSKKVVFGEAHLETPVSLKVESSIRRKKAIKEWVGRLWGTTERGKTR